jgi:hypothetical protein
LSGWVDELHVKYKHLFETYDGEGDGMYGYKEGDILRGIEVGDAWKEIVVRLLDTLEWHRTHNTYVPNPDYVPDPDNPYSDTNPKYLDGGPNMVQVFQIKEKFGKLRVSVKCAENIREGVEHAIGYAEGQSDLTCYSCGSVGRWEMSTKSWMIRLCDKCVSEREKEEENEMQVL